MKMYVDIRNMIALKIFAVLGFLACNSVQQQPQSEYGFEEVIKKSSFVDKTLFLKTFLDNENFRVMVSAPHGTGKSTALDMVRRFLEIHADDQGSPIKPNTTKDYKLFKQNNLDISKHEDTFDKHFGQHPVLLIDCQPLSKINSYYELLVIFKKWLREAFTKHKYLLHRKKLWKDQIEVDHFNELMRESNIKYGPSYMIEKLVRLSELLKIHFEKQVLVLVDDYDAFLDSPEVSYNPESDHVVSFLHTFSTEFLRLNPFIGRVLITGVFRDTKSKVSDFSFLFPEGTANFTYLDKIPEAQWLVNV